MSQFKTPRGTILPILNLRGKDYLQVQHRLIWFTEERPDWSIETEMVERTKDSAISKATIKNKDGRTMSTAHKFEDRSGFGDFIEKSETGAIGRALALVGFGTQFCADDLDEGSRLADSPAPRICPEAQKTAVANPPKSTGQSKMVTPTGISINGKSIEPVVNPKIISSEKDENRQRVMGAASKNAWTGEQVSKFLTFRYGVGLVRELRQDQVDEAIKIILAMSFLNATETEKEPKQIDFDAYKNEKDVPL